MSDLLVPRRVAAQAAAAPGALAVGTSAEVLTYGELDRRANQLAHHLGALGVRADTPVGLYMERSCDLVVGALGIMRAGGAYVPLDPSYPAERLNFMLRDSRAPVVVSRGEVPTGIAPVECRVVTCDRDGAGLLSGSDGPPAVEIGSDHLAYVIYTSGSTGLPKGVAVTHGNLLNLVSWHQRAFAVIPADRATQLASPGFDAAVWELWPYLTAGAAIHLPDDGTRMDPARLRDWLVSERITIGFVPTPLAESLITLTWPPETALRTMLTGGDALHRFPPSSLPFAVVNNYGPTEATVVTTSGLVPVEGGSRLLPSIGRPIDGVKVYVVDEKLQPVPPGVAGELVIGGAGLARGYLHRPELTEASFVKDPFSADAGARLYHSGDLVRCQADGELEFLGRLDDQVKIRGQRVELGEIEAALDRHQSVRSSVVVVAGVQPQERRLVAYAVPAAGHRADPGQLRAHLAQTLPDYMLPGEFVWITEVPVTPNGKVDRAALPALGSNGVRAASNGHGPSGPVEGALVGIVAELLGLDTVGTDENFFMLGGHSLLGAQLIARISELYGVELPLRSVFDGPTVAEMAAAIEALLLAEVEALSEAEAERLVGAGDAMIPSPLRDRP